MPSSALGVVLRALRDRRNLSLRDLGKLAEIDHAYIHRLESGEKESPSEDTLAKLAKHLKPNAHELMVLRYVRDKNIDSALALHALGDSDATADILDIAAAGVYRGSTRPDPIELIRRAKRAKEIMNS